MSKQYNKVVKRARRKGYLQRRKARAWTKTTAGTRKR